MSRLLALACLLVIAGACGDSASDAGAPAETGAVAEEGMRAIGLTQWPAIVGDYRSRILVVDLWASWCTNCIERFPAMIALSKKYADDGVQFISLNLDDPGDTEALDWSKKFLKKMQAGFPHYHIRENIMESFEKLDLLGIPVVLVFDKSGAERYRLTGDDPNNQFSEADVEQAIVELLAES